MDILEERTMDGYQQALKAYIEATNSHNFDNVERLLAKEAVY
ncbi:hypothetical protein CathTA2_0245 [Caldalkalibacillus thermarum TA2.A1]|uniref:Uncharacterized protein n=1 Tax=Caldalkalibacillus thermarum (strain TA2.A1) TaxID=986075 RepID=F5L383_CALTT|nr:hypothetical protein [Caldalkalibacillus thermarum]EGL84200.1 hypothetical protein CathTA2_0245 [Caldalkalibacillus thermarum TA2.A1]